MKNSDRPFRLTGLLAGLLARPTSRRVPCFLTVRRHYALRPGDNNIAIGSITLAKRLSG